MKDPIANERPALAVAVGATASIFAARAEESRRIQDLLEANNRYLQEARDARADKKVLQRQIDVLTASSSRWESRALKAEAKLESRPAGQVSLGSRTDAEIVEQTEMLARTIMREALGVGYVVGEAHVFHEATDSRSRKAWQVACFIMEELTATDPNDAVMSLEADEQEA